ncbi:glycosyltransferase family 2 protein [Flavobacterium muglaense]|uniref:Glycosyltransferase family 2 protein n=1 Tax=Flavobacterium muglaense TaxID=2764716 RepID=A0A923MVQ1_9FLAO|nr:glycosyltransferase family 2 protein [Flavobacterium muglaense]MBC5836626.1 glycosyltransferase family 2 protein [Flavobacterium muglaense]MBC5843108.1 glycosyltransferase family 2 protein [Flavobacterium muglaense]
MKTTKISAAILTFNSEKNIENVLKKLYWCDEIIILDSFSTDETITICKKYTSLIFENKFEGFGPQKKLLISKCKNNWVISVDSDEVLNDELISNILKLTNDDFENNDGFLINIKHIFLNKQFKGKESKSWTLRLFNKKKGNVNSNIVHESITVQGNISKVKGAILHYTVSELKDAIYKMDFYSRLKAEEYYKNNKKCTWIKLYITLPFTFFREYILHRNFMNGYQGYLWSSLVAQGSALKYYYLKELYN